MAIVNEDTHFTKRVTINRAEDAKEETTPPTNPDNCGCGDDALTPPENQPELKGYANITGDENINFKVADGVAGKDAVNVRQLKNVKAYTFDYICEKEPVNAPVNAVWLDISNQANGLIKIKRLTAKGSEWVTAADNVAYKEEIKATLEAYKAEIDKRIEINEKTYALKEGSQEYAFNVADAVNEAEAINLKQLNEALKAKENTGVAYTKDEMDAIVAGLAAKGEQAGPFTIKGELTQAELDVVQNPTAGDMYYITDTKKWVTRVGTEWVITEDLFSANNYLTREQVIAALALKSDKSTTNGLETIVRNLQVDTANLATKEELNKAVEDLKNGSQAGFVTLDTEQEVNARKTFNWSIRYKDTVAFDENTEEEVIPNIKFVRDSIANAPQAGYTKDEVNKLIEPLQTKADGIDKTELAEALKDYVQRGDAVLEEEVEAIIQNWFRNNDDIAWKGYKATKADVEAVQNKEVGDIYGVVNNLTNASYVYMWDGDKWILLSSTEKSVENGVLVIENPVIKETSAELRALGTHYIEIPLVNGPIEILGVYKTENDRKVSVAFNVVNNGKVICVLFNSATLAEITYITSAVEPEYLDIRNFVQENRDNLFTKTNTFEEVRINVEATEDVHPVRLVDLKKTTGTLDDLGTTNKDTLVAAINEVLDSLKNKDNQDDLVMKLLNAKGIPIYYDEDLRKFELTQAEYDDLKASVRNSGKFFAIS